MWTSTHLTVALDKPQMLPCLLLNQSGVVRLILQFLLALHVQGQF